MDSGTLQYTGNSAALTRGLTLAAGGGGISNATAGQLLTVSSTITNGTSTLTLGGAGDGVLTNSLSGSGNVVMLGTGTWTLGNTISGATAGTSYDIQNGTLAGESDGVNSSLGGATILLDGGNMGLSASASYTFTNPITILNNSTVTAFQSVPAGGAANQSIGLSTPMSNPGEAVSFASTDGDTLSITGALSGSGSFGISGASSLVVLSSDISGFGGTLTLGGGTLTLNYASATTIPNAITASAATTVQNVGKLILSGTQTLAGNTVTYNVAAVAGLLPDGLAGDVEFTGAVSRSSDGAGIVKTGLGTLIISGTADDASLGVTVNQGTVLLNKTSSSAAHAVGGGGLVINNGGTAQITGSGGDQIYDLAGGVTINDGGVFDLNGQSETIFNLSLGDATGAGTLENNLPNSSAVLKTGNAAVSPATGTFTLVGNSNIVAAADSTLELQVDGAAPAPGAGHILTANGNGTGVILLTGTTDNTNVEVAVTSGTLVLGKTSSGTAHAASTVTGVSPGAVLQLAGTGGDQIYDGFVTGTTDFGVFNMNGTFDMNGQSEGFDKLTGSGTLINSQTGITSTLSLGTGNGVGPTASDFTGAITGNIALVKVNAPTAPAAQEPVILSGANTYSGGTTITAGILQIGDGGSGGTLGTGPVTDNDTLNFNRGDAGLMVANAIGGGGVVNQNGAGTVTLTAINTYGGNTNVNDGVLTLAASGTIASANFNVASGATGNINGLLTNTPNVTDDGTIKVGANPGSGILARTWSSLAIGATPATLSIAAPSASANRTVLITGSLSNSGLMDLSGNDLVVHNGNATAITSQIAQGYNGGNWHGTAGITSSSAAALSNTALGVELNSNGSGGVLLSSFDGQSVTSTDVLVKYTYFGDANLDGVVNGSDYTLIDNGFNNTLTGWHNGDFNYDGVVNGDDYTLIDNAFNTQGASLAAEPMEMVAIPTSQIAGGSLAAVPEPGNLGVAAVAAAVLWRRRRRS